jgi:alkanesulfonate monooxygenase SsuD/methylene tetrahydromethanopterin reductase-like flavin-dependent oxidoreductase (luciferase family)
MTIDQRICDAINKSTYNHGQPQSVADRITAWFEAIASGADTLTDSDDATRRIQELLRAIETSGSDGDVT